MLRSLFSRLKHSMATDFEHLLTPLRQAVKEQGDVVRILKEKNVSKSEITSAVAELKLRKKALEAKEKSLTPKQTIFDKQGVEDLMKRRFFVTPSFAIYGGVAGLYDYGPLGCALKSNMISVWKEHFIEEESMLEVECSVLTPEQTLKASGHAERFTDLMVKDLTTGEFFRADHLLEEHLNKLMGKAGPELKAEYKQVLTQVESYSKEELGAKLEKYGVKSPVTGNPVSQPVELNLMFATSIGPSGQLPSFLRPETAQGIFVNFKRLLEFNAGRLPFAAAQIGKAFRNEISPRSGILRVREFEMAEIEHFVNPEKKNKFSKFSLVADLMCTLYTSCDQIDGKPPKKILLRDAVEQGIVANETLGYYIGRIFLFLLRVGIKEEHLRFRQHMDQEMAHYAKDCWDAECRTSYGWVECVGCADRSCYDLAAHSKVTKVDLCAKEPLPAPVTVDVVEVSPEKGIIGKHYRKDAKLLLDWLAGLNEEQVNTMEKSITTEGKCDVELDGKVFTVQPDMVKFKKYTKEEFTKDVVPSVIEPSFGIGRILYSVLEHNFQVRPEDKQRVWLSLPSVVAPISCSVLPLSGQEQFHPYVREIESQLKTHHVRIKVDDSSGSIGRRYARTDEIGIPYGVTVDFDTVAKGTVTLRERDSMRQVRIEISALGGVLRDLISGAKIWADIEAVFPVFTGQEHTS